MSTDSVPQYSGIYLIVNAKNNRIYIGQSINIKRRWKEHRTDLNNGRHPNLHLQAAWNKYGEKSFKFSVLEYCSVDDLNKREQHYLDIYMPKGNCYNKAKDVRSNMRGLKMSDESRRKISIAKTNPSAETRLKLSVAGRNRSPETLQKMSESSKGRHHSDATKRMLSIIAKGMSSEHRQKLIESRKGKPISETHRQRIIESNTGKTVSEETKQKLRDANVGKQHSEETKRKMSESHKGNQYCLGNQHTDETKRKISESGKKAWEKRRANNE